MSVTIAVVCFKSKTLANGEHPLMLRITQDRKRVMKSLGISVNPQHWDFTKGEPKPKCPNKELIQSIILKVKAEYQTKVIEKLSREEEFTATSLVYEQRKNIKAQTVEEFYLSLIKELKEDGRIGTSYAYLNSYRTLKNFNKGKKLNYTFSYIDVEFCKKFEKWMRSKGNNDVTISYQFRSLRAAFNKAIEAKIVSKDKTPFIEYKLSRFNTKTAKRALSKEDILKIIDADCSHASEIRQFTQDIFTFSYLCGGISFVDIAHLTGTNIVEDRLLYKRQKTHGSINLILTDRAKQIIQKYSCYQRQTGYLFPILHNKRHVTPIAKQIIQKYSYYQRQTGYLFPILHNKRHVTPMQQNNRVHKICHQINTELRAFAKELGITAEVTTYVARHSFATILKKSGVNIGIISQALGHQDIKTTQIYLSKFDNEQVDDAMKNLL